MAKDRESDTTTITVRRDFANILRGIADKRRLTIGEALERYAGAALAREWKKCQEETEVVYGGEA